MIKSIFKDISFLVVLAKLESQVSQTEKYGETISTDHDGKVKHGRVF